jgi:PPK2 family polyphosphate:nucleotide phosphotransferase
MKIDVDRFRVKSGTRVRLHAYDPAHTGSFRSKKQAASRLAKGIDRLFRLQELLYAQDRWAVLLVFQGLDAAGKDGMIKHVMSGLNPQGTTVVSFKTPSAEEIDHDFMWRTLRVLPERGQIGVFNRSHYEEALIVRVHPEILAAERLPSELVTRRIWQERFEDINAIERYLTRNGTVIRKFFLHVSKAEQRQRFLDRLSDPAKNWKFSLSDTAERKRWPDYVRAYEEVLSATSTPQAPWFIIPADSKWFARLVVAEIIIDTLESLSLKFPVLSEAQQRTLRQAKRQLRAEDHGKE